MTRFSIVFLILTLLSKQLFANTLNGSLEIGTSVSHSYSARNIFANPAALAFETELNDIGLISSFTYAANKTRAGEFSLGLAYGYFGVGFEQLAFDTGTFNRYNFAVSLPATSKCFFGLRYSVTGAEFSPYNGIHSIDLGLQYRAFTFLSFGFLVNKINQPTTVTVKSPVQYVAGVTLRPIERVTFSLDADTLSNNFGKKIEYQAAGSIEILSGLSLSAGYHSNDNFQTGLQFTWKQAEIFSKFQPSSKIDRRFIFGFQTTVLPGKSFLNPQTALNLSIGPTLSEEGKSGSLFTNAKPSLFNLLETLKDAENSNVSQIILKIESFPLGLSAAQDLSEALFRLREKGKHIDVFLGNASTKEYLIASAANKIHLETGGELRFLGPRSVRFYAKGLFDKFGIEPQFLAKGKYKSAPETFSRKESSKENKEATLHELQSMETALSEILIKNRKTSSDWNKLTDQGLYSPEEALAAKLIDSISSYQTQLQKTQVDFPILENLKENRNNLSLPPIVAIIVADGNILQRKVRFLSFAGEPQVTPDKMERLFHKALGNTRIKAIVLRVSSSGGEVLASDEIAAIVESAKGKKPIVVSMGDVAASGGYMISAAADKIFAQPLTVTGSIGVFLGKFSLAGLFSKLDLRKEITSRAPYAGLFSESRPWSDKERTLMTRRLDQYYDGFISFVSKRRQISKMETESAAQGRVWLGSDAKRLKLVDAMGGYREALLDASVKAGIAGDFEARLISNSGGVFQFLDEDGLMSQISSMEKFPTGLFSSKAIGELFWIASLNENPFLYWASGNILE